MLFSSTTFIYLFLPAVLFFYYVVFRKSRLLQNIFLLLASLAFYAWGEPVFVLIMIGSILVNWLFGLLADRYRENRTAAKAMIAADVVINLGILFIFKYLTFTGRVLDRFFGISLTLPHIALPIGISFFTFQAMSYVIDVYRRDGEVQKNILNVGLYISFFPQLIAGPIVRYSTIADEIKNRKETLNDFLDGFSRFVIGLGKKVLLANALAIVADRAFNSVSSGASVSVLFSWLGAIAYTLQIFFDFCGYSDMAIGLGRMFGFHFLENFNYPYISASITEYWKRWHISLGSWFRDYVYIPLGGNRCSKARSYLNLLLVWLLTGLWHGANYTFIAWGLMYYVLLVFEKQTGLPRKGGRILSVFKHVYAMFFVVIGRVLFRAPSIGSAARYLRYMFGLASNVLSDPSSAAWLKQNAVMLAVGIVLCTPVFRVIGEKTKNSSAAGWIKVIGLFLIFVLSVASLVNSSYNPFIYFNF